MSSGGVIHPVTPGIESFNLLVIELEPEHFWVFGFAVVDRVDIDLLLPSPPS